MNQQPNNQSLSQPLNEPMHNPENNSQNNSEDRELETNYSAPPTPQVENLEEQDQTNKPLEVMVPFAPIVPPLPPANESGAADFLTSKPELSSESFDFSTGPIVVPGAPEDSDETPDRLSWGQADAKELQDNTTVEFTEPPIDESTETLEPTNAPYAPPAEKSNLTARIITALIGIPLVALLVWRAETDVFNLVVAFLALLGLRELSKALRAAQMPLVGSLAYPALIALLFVQPLTTNYPRWGAMIIWVMPFLLMVLLLITSVLRYPSGRRPSLQAIALTLFATLYAGLFVFLILLRSLRSGPLDFLEDAPRLGYALLWLTVLSVWSGDIIAYFAGRKFGVKKLTTLSPGKTWEGAIAGFVATVAVCVPIAVRLQFEMRDGLILGVLIALAAPLGDLAESFWKRELAIKDMGGALPGHGGILDRCDSLLFAAFAVYIYAQIWMLN